MCLPFYASPEQIMADKAEFARKGIGRGKSIIALEYGEGVLLVAENSTSLSKVGEIYDRIAFAGVGKFSEFDQLRKIGVRFADTKGYAYSREELDQIADRAVKIAGMSKSLTLVANNHYQGKEAMNALEIKARVTGRKVDVPPELLKRYPRLQEIARNLPEELPLG